MKSKELAAWLRENKVSEVSCIVPDFSGTARGKSMTPSLFLDGYENKTLRIPEGAYAIGVHGEFTYNRHIDDSERDLVLYCDTSTIHRIPWTKDTTAAVICDGLLGDGTPFPVAPRQVLKNVINLFGEHGWQPVVGPEVEFYLIAQFEDTVLKPRAPKGASGVAEFGQYTYSLDAVDDFDEFFEALYEYCDVQGIQLDTLIHEDGPCQFEINLKHGDALKIADQLFLFKRLSRHVAKRFGFFVTFMAKPYADECGSSIHLHQSVIETKTGRNIFSNEDGSDSDVFEHYIGGLQKFLPAAMPLFAPYTNSYTRFEAYMSAPTNVHWGRENRTVGLRVPESGPSARRVENRICGSDVNPYFAIAASLLCGYLGIIGKVDRRPEFLGQSYLDKSGELPASLADALREFRHCEEFRRYLGDPLVDTYADAKQHEYEDRSRVLSPWDVRYLMLNV